MRSTNGQLIAVWGSRAPPRDGCQRRDGLSCSVPVMPVAPTPAPPEEQVALRRWLEGFLHLRDTSFCHHDEFWALNGGLVQRHGWGTRIERGPRQTPIEVWFDWSDHDITVWGGRDRGGYFEWVDLSNMAHVLDSLESTLRVMLGTDPVTTSSA